MTRSGALLIDYRPNSELADVDVKGMTVRLTFDSVKGDVLNVVPPHRAGDIAQKTMVAVKGAGGVSDKASELEGTYAWGWARNIWAEALG